MATWTKSEIRKKVRQVTGRLSSNEITDAELDDRINKFYQYTFPSEVKLERNHVYYEFLTEAYQPYYDGANGDFTNFEPPALIDMMLMEWHQEPMNFYSSYPMQVTSLTPWTGDGVTQVFNTSVAPYTIYPGTVVISDNTETFADENTTWSTAPVAINGSLGGVAALNYATGAIAVTFNAAPALGQLIYVSYTAMAVGKPGAVLWYNNLFQMYPVPDKPYRFRVKAYQRLAPLTLATDRPLLDQWGPCIAYGTARDLVVDYGEMDSFTEITALYKEQVSYALNRTTQNLLNTRSAPSF